MEIDLRYQFLTDLLLTLHVAVVVFVIGGLPLIIGGNLRIWRWVNILVQARSSCVDRGHFGGGLDGRHLSPHQSRNVAAHEGAGKYLQRRLNRTLASMAALLRSSIMGILEISLQPGALNRGFS